MSSARTSERGSTAVEVAVIAPAFVILMLLVVYAGRVSATDAAVTRAAAAAARAASLRQHPTDATDDAEAAARANLTSSGTVCDQLEVLTDTTDFRAGGTVAVTINCHTSMANVALLGVPGTRTFTGRAVEVIDRFRGDVP
jgi:Flp pilus assembly protein TadG